MEQTPAERGPRMDAFDAVESAMIQLLAKRYKDGNYAVFWPEMVATLATVSDDCKLIARVQAHLAQRKLLLRGTIEPPSRIMNPWRRTGEEGYDCVPCPAIREVAAAIGAERSPGSPDEPPAETVTLSPQQLRAIYDINQDTLRKRLGNGVIPAEKVNSKSYRVRVDKLPEGWRAMLDKATGRNRRS